MLETVSTIDKSLAARLGEWEATEQREFVENEPQSRMLPVASSWFLSTGNVQYAHLYIHHLLGADKTVNTTQPIEETLNWLSAEGVRIENPADVRSYLLRYSDLLLVIPSVWKSASALLLPATQFTLALYRDSEISDEYLTLYARQTNYEVRILDKIDVVNIECESLLSGKSGWLLTTTDFHSPK